MRNRCSRYCINHAYSISDDARVVSERDSLYRGALCDIANTWRGQQTLQGPMLVGPFVEKHVNKETTTDEQGKEKVKTKSKYVTKYAVNLPKTLNIDVDLSEQHRKRGICKPLVYKADTSLAGSFDMLNIESLSDHMHRIDWNNAGIILFSVIINCGAHFFLATYFIAALINIGLITSYTAVALKVRSKAGFMYC
ncbi:MAG: inner membrane CreD family protein [Gammaproteobacteria bacterium]|nr:inner membrane CreD family protein [Gammaproteobacteria bacterium]